MVDISALLYWETEPREYRDCLAVSPSNKIPSYLIVKVFFLCFQIGGGRVAENMFVRFPLHSFFSQVAFLKFCLLCSLSYIWSVLFSIWSFLAMYSYVREENQRATSGTLVQRKLWNSALDEEACQPAFSEAKQAPQNQPFMCCVTFFFNVLCDFYVLCDCSTSPLSWSRSSTDLSELKEESYSAFLRRLGKRNLIVF